jgi:hypothetical protein
MNLRQADQDELRASTGMEPLDALIYSVNHSDRFVEIIWDDDTAEILGVFGLGSLNGNGIPWLVLSPNFKKYKRQLQRYAKTIIIEMQQAFSYLFNLVDSRNVVHIRWIKFMGFKFDDGKDMVWNGVAFRYFYMGE